MKRNTETIEIIRERVIEADGAKYKYTLLVKEIRRHFAPKLPSYSIRIEMLLPSGDVTRDESGFIFVDFGKAIVFYERLIEHLCTPLNLPYILNDSIEV